MTVEAMDSQAVSALKPKEKLRAEPASVSASSANPAAALAEAENTQVDRTSACDRMSRLDPP